MKDKLSILKGIHPGLVLDRELKKRDIPKGPFAISIKEYPQTIGVITKGRRDMNTALSLRIEEALNIEEGFFMQLQLFYDIEKIKKNANGKPDLTKLRPSLFWDTNIVDINWQKYRKAVIRRIFERGNEEEKKEIIRFYGSQVVDKVLKQNQEIRTLTPK